MPICFTSAWEQSGNCTVNLLVIAENEWNHDNDEHMWLKAPESIIYEFGKQVRIVSAVGKREFTDGEVD